jgi:hypothetical protein
LGCEKRAQSSAATKKRHAIVLTMKINGRTDGRTDGSIFWNDGNGDCHFTLFIRKFNIDVVFNQIVMFYHTIIVCNQVVIFTQKNTLEKIAFCLTTWLRTTVRCGILNRLFCKKKQLDYKRRYCRFRSSYHILSQNTIQTQWIFC